MSETAYIYDFFQLVDMKVLILENSLDNLLNVKISINGGQSYTDYSVSSLKNGGLTLDCNPSDLKVICDTNILNYIKVFADGEKLNTGSGCGECGSSNSIYKLICKKSDFHRHKNDKHLCNEDVYDPEGGIVYPLHLLSEEVKYMYNLAELPKELENTGYHIDDVKVKNIYRGKIVVELSLLLIKDGEPMTEMKTGLYKIPIYTKLWANDPGFSVKLGELHIEVVDE